MLEYGDETPENTSLVMLANALKRPTSWLLTHNNYQPTENESLILQEYLTQFVQGVPLPYIIGTWSFFGRGFIVSPDVLIPRPETELLIEKALALAAKMDRPRIIDIGTGSGIIAITLGASLPKATMVATDLSLKTIRLARRNARRHHQTQIHFIQCNLLQAVKYQFDLICVNPPYIPTKTLSELDVSRWEPQLALDGGDSGLRTIDPFLRQAKSQLAPQGAILIEIEATLGEPALTLARQVFPEAQVTLHQDLAGKDRLIEIQQT